MTVRNSGVGPFFIDPFLALASILYPIKANFSIIYPLKTPGHQMFLGVFRVYKIQILIRNGLGKVKSNNKIVFCFKIINNSVLSDLITECDANLLPHFTPIFHFYIPWKRIEMEQWDGLNNCAQLTFTCSK